MRVLLAYPGSIRELTVQRFPVRDAPAEELGPRRHLWPPGGSDCTAACSLCSWRRPAAASARPSGSPGSRRVKCNALIVNWAGNAFDPLQTWSINKVKRKDHARAGRSLDQEITPHALRHFFSDHIKRTGIDPYGWNVLCGDVPRGNEATYEPGDASGIDDDYSYRAPPVRRIGRLPRRLSRRPRPTLDLLQLTDLAIQCIRRHCHTWAAPERS